MRGCAALFPVLLLVTVLIPGCLQGSSSDTDPATTTMTLVESFEGGNHFKAGPVSVLQLHGTNRQMGRQYGHLLRQEMAAAFATFQEVFPPKMPEPRLQQIASAVYAVYPQNWRDVIEGMAETSGLGLGKQIMLNSLEFFPKIDSAVPHCSGLGVWGDYTGGGPLLFGRNNDDAEIYKRFGAWTVVTVFNPTDGAIPMAIVNYAGLIYAPNGMNRHGLFLELNAGNWQGYEVERPSIFVTLMTYLQTCATHDDLLKAFQSLSPNMSSIVNVADATVAYSFECPLTGVKRRDPDENGLLTSSNHFLDPSWGIAPPGPPDDTVPRRDNFIALAKAHKGRIDLDTMKKIMDTYMPTGAANPGTIYQIIAVPRDLTMWLKAPGTFDWQKVELAPLFAGH